jgi:acetyltransferase-like isoleucine patch superfamily enzyme
LFEIAGLNTDYWIRRLLGKATCVMGSGAKLLPTARIRNAAGDSVRIRVGRKTLVAGELLVFAHGGEIKVGEWSYVGEGARIWSAGSIHIGNRVLISHNVNIFDSLTHPLLAQERHTHFKTIVGSGHPATINLGERPVVVEDDAWIGANAIVLRGVNVGKGAVIGAGAVVTRNIPSFTFAAGNPARIIRKLNTDE